MRIILPVAASIGNAASVVKTVVNSMGLFVFWLLKNSSNIDVGVVSNGVISNDSNGVVSNSGFIVVS